VERARQLHASEQLDEALEQLESIPVTDRTDSCRQYSAALQEELDALERKGTELAAVGGYDEALELFRNLSEQRRPRSWSAWRDAAKKVDQLREQLNAELPKARLENCLRILEELRTLQPSRWEHEPRLASVVRRLVTRAIKSLKQGQTDKAGRLLAKIPASLQTDAVRKAIVRQQRQAVVSAAALLRVECPFSAETARKAQATLARSLQMPEEWTNSVGMKFRPIPVGTYKRITLTKPFWLGVHQVTQGQWLQVVGTTPWKGKEFTIEGADVAASCVSWDDAMAFCKKLSRKEGKRYRLPTEAEWEWACRAGTMTAYSFGDDGKQLGEYAWFDGNAYDKGERYPHRVGQKKSNPFGLYDVHGNVWEWCSDCHEDGNPLEEEAIDPQGPPFGSFRILRGGSWVSAAIYLRSSNRNYKAPGRRNDGIGCRVLCECG
jgi:formylglycine-generating enzyme required for sulfatase activity